MDLTVPLQSLIPTVDAAALTVLAGTEGALGQSQIHRLARRGSRRGLVLALERLVEHGLVIAEPTNHGHQYRLNRNHVLAAAVLAGIGARGEFLARLTTGCQSLKPTVISATLFGSVARDESDPQSDTDLLLVVDDGTDTSAAAWQDQLHALRAQALIWSGNRLEIITTTPAGLAEAVANGESIMESWLTDGVTLTGTDIDQLIGTAFVRAPN